MDYESQASLFTSLSMLAAVVQLNVQEASYYWAICDNSCVEAALPDLHRAPVVGEAEKNQCLVG